MDNKVYCGLVFGSSPDVALGNYECKTNLVPAEPEDGYVWVDVPENMESKAYYVRAFMVSEQERIRWSAANTYLLILCALKKTVLTI